MTQPISPDARHLNCADFFLLYALMTFRQTIKEKESNLWPEPLASQAPD